MSGSAFLLGWTPLLPWPAIAALGGLGLLILAVGAARRARGIVWRAVAVAILLAALVNPSLIEQKRQLHKDVVVVVLDRSASMGIGNRRDVADRALAEVRKELAGEPGLDVRIVRAGQSALGADDRGTRLFAAFDRAMANLPRRRLAGVVMITDGEAHDVPRGDRKALAQRVGAPLHVLLTGKPNEKDRRLVVTAAPSYGLVGKDVTLSVRVEDEPAAKADKRAATEEAELTWRKDGGAPHRRVVPVGEDAPFDVPIGHGGPNVIELAVAPGPHSLTPVNKRAVVVVNGVRDRLRVLLVSGQPNRDERVWRNILKSDPSVDLVHFTILRPPEKQDNTPIRELSLIAFPIRELFDVKLKQFDLIIFDQYNREGIIPQDYLRNVARYVRNGGAFLEAAGPNFGSPLSLDRTPLGAILPTEPTGEVDDLGFKPRLTALGHRHPVTAGLAEAGPPGGTPAWGRLFRQVDARVKAGVTLMRGAKGEPLLVLDRVGKGRVAQLLTDQLWLWARGFEGGGPQAELLRRLAYWLMKEPELSENALRASILDNRLVVTRQSLKPDDSPVTVTPPGGEKASLRLTPDKGGRSTGSMSVKEMGLYHVTDGLHTAIAAAGPLNPIEFADVRTTAEKLQPVADATGGGIFWVASAGVPQARRVSADASAAGRNWMGFRENDDYTVVGFSEMPLLPGIAALLLVVGGLLAAWRREGR
ncbi:MAG TPA: hypothetical protein VGR91_00870 [Stellaceae bacterium]|nr:hypothetical protein [Stellaceae bacterium]